VTEEYNKFQDKTTLNVTGNWVKSVANADDVNFVVSYDIEEGKDAPSKGLLLLAVENGKLDGSKGSHLWLHIDGEKKELLCFRKSGWDQKETSGSIIAGTLFTSTTTTPHRYYAFVLNFDVLKKIANAESVWFELETGNNLIKGVFGPKNFQAISNLVQKIEEKTGEKL
jgi:hypothetical protein